MAHAQGKTKTLPVVVLQLLLAFDRICFLFARNLNLIFSVLSGLD